MPTTVAAPQWSNEILERYEIGELKGAGSYGQVYKGKDKKTGQSVAIKKVFDVWVHPRDARSSYRELALLRTFKGHPNLISLQYAAMSIDENDNKPSVEMVFPYYPFDLSHFAKASQRKLSPTQITSIWYQILCGIHYMHSAHMVHRDLKPQNILSNQEHAVAICDLGFARTLQTIAGVSAPESQILEQLSPEVVTLYYRSPELLLTKKARYPTDMWSIGCIFAELLLKKLLFPATSDAHLQDLIFNLIGAPSPEDCEQMSNRTDISGLPARYSRNVPQNFNKKFPEAGDEQIDLLKRLLEFNPEKRITAAEALKHPLFKSCRNSENEKIYSLPTTPVGRASLRDYYRHEIRAETQDKEEPSEAEWDIQIEEVSSDIQTEIQRYQSPIVQSPSHAKESMFHPAKRIKVLGPSPASNNSQGVGSSP